MMKKTQKIMQLFKLMNEWKCNKMNETLRYDVLKQ